MSQNIASVPNLFTPGGRFVSGDLMKKGDKDYETGAPIPEDKQEYYFGVAVPKNQPGMNELLTTLNSFAHQAYAQAPVILAQIGMGLAAPDFSWKVEDGDIAKVDRSTGQYKDIPDYIRGCYIIKFKTRYEFGACDENGNDINRADIKKGDYMDVMFTLSPNGRMDHNAGVILYPNAVRRLGYGDPIGGGAVDASKAFAGQQAVIPPGATQMPTAAAGAMPPATMGQPQQPMGQPQQQPMGQPQQQPMGQPQQQPMGQPDPNVAGGMPQATGQPAMGAGGGMPVAGGGMPPASQGMATTSHGDPAAMGVQPHTNILHGPQGGGMPQG